MRIFKIFILIFSLLCLSAAVFAADENFSVPENDKANVELNILNENDFLTEDETLTNPELAEILNAAFNRFIVTEEYSQPQTEDNTVSEDIYNYFAGLPLVEQQNTRDILVRLLQDYKNDQTVIPNDLAMRIEETLSKFDLNEYHTEKPNTEKPGVYLSVQSKERSGLDNSVWSMPFVASSGVDNSSPVSDAIESRLSSSDGGSLLGIRRSVQDFEYALRVALFDSFSFYGGINVEGSDNIILSDIMANFEKVNKARFGVQFNIIENKSVGIGGVVQYNLNKVNATDTATGATSYGTGITTGLVFSW